MATTIHVPPLVTKASLDRIFRSPPPPPSRWPPAAIRLPFHFPQQAIRWTGITYDATLRNRDRFAAGGGVSVDNLDNLT